MGKSLKEQLALLKEHEQADFLAALNSVALKQMAREDWWYTSRPEQNPPEGDWSVCLFCAGRGSGKTRTGSEWLVQRSLDFPADASGFPTERLVMAYNLSEAVQTCIEGPSGIMRVLQRLEVPYHYVKAPRPYIIFEETEAKIHFSGDSVDAPRGKNLADVWLDEPIKFKNFKAVWKEGVRPALRADLIGDKPRAFVTTTPKPIPLLREWLADTTGRYITLRGSTFDNATNLSQDVLDELRETYEGTLLGRQELYGELIEDMEGPLFSYADIHNNRVEIGPERVAHRVVAVDPNLTGDEDQGDLMGVVVASRSSDDHIYILADESRHLTGREAALHTWHVFARYQCDTLVIEDNLAKAWLAQVMTDVFQELVREGFFPPGSSPPLKRVHSNQGKKLRAEPVALRYQQGRVHHIGTFEKLENELTGWDPVNSKTSPDRLDALVHACKHLMDGERRKMRLVTPQSLLIPDRSSTISGGINGSRGGGSYSAYRR